MSFDDTWPMKAACKTEDPELFFDRRTEDEAKKICRACPVIEECRADAIALGDFEGVRGGRTGLQLRVIARGPREYKNLTAANEEQRVRTEALLKEIAAHALAGRIAAEITILVGRNRNTVDHHLAHLRSRGDIPNSAGRKPRTLPPVKEHGGRSGYDAHRRRGEDVCAECLEGYATNQRRRRAEIAARVRA